MKKNQETFFKAIFIAFVISIVFFTMMPQKVSTEIAPPAEFSVPRALAHVSKIAEKPHYTGSLNHQDVLHYIETELQKLNLQTEIQEGTTLSDWGNLVKSKNIIARIKGSSSSKAVLLLSHYDSAPHSFAPGAADNATGVATILEAIRAFLHTNTPHKNDIIILFTDAEELGLNGAALFVTKHKWAKDVGIVVNFEARGTSGPSFMLMETNKGNASLVNAFSEASTSHPVASSLMYSVYKMMPNDTDLTVFREHGNIPGYNFAFIDSHFNYHTAQDDLSHLDHRSVLHQGSYLMPLLNHLSNANLSNLETAEDKVYFNVPFLFIDYPFSWVFTMLIIAVMFFLFFVFIGLGRRSLIMSDIGKGFLYLFGTLIASGILTFFGWKILLAIYPGYSDILQGFTYNGHIYILAFTFLSLAVSFLFYAPVKHETTLYSYTVAPVLLWIIICIALAIYLPGAAFLSIPLLCSVLILGFYCMTQRSSEIVNSILAVPGLCIIVPLIWMFPIGLGLKILVGSSVLTVLLFSLILPIMGSFSGKAIWSAAMFVIAIVCFVFAHIESGFEPGKAKPNSLVYYMDNDTDKAYWASYDNAADEWTKKKLGANAGGASYLNQLPLLSKYNTLFTFSSAAETIDLAKPTISFYLDTIIGNWRHLKIRIKPNRNVNRYDIYASESLQLHHFKANGATALEQKNSLYPRHGKKLLSYYVVGNEPLELEFTIEKNAVPNLELLESSFDLLTNPALDVNDREPWMMPKPFILNDAIIVKQRIRPLPKTVRMVQVPVNTISTDTIPTIPPVTELDSVQ